MSQGSLVAEEERAAPLMSVGRAAAFFGVVYFSQGICQLVTLMNQPVRMYLDKVAGFGAEEVARFFFVATIPWMIKPAYGLLTDFFPLFGYRRKSYLMVLSLAAAGAFLGVTGVSSVEALLAMVVVVGVGVAASDVVVDAMMVQAGRESGRTRLFQGAQWLSLNLAAIGSGVLGAWICDRWKEEPARALDVAALVAMCLPVVVAGMTWWVVRDRPARMNVGEFRETGRALVGALVGALMSQRVWVVVLFIVLIKFNPGTVTPMYEHLVDRVGLSRSYLAVLDTLFAVGQAAGAGVFMVALSGRMSVRRVTVIGLVVGAAGLVPMLMIQGKASAGVAYAVWGATDMVAVLSQLTVAAVACPRRVEAVTFAALMSVWNVSQQYSDVAGSWAYEGFLGGRVGPLIWVSMALTLAGLLVVPFLSGSERDSENGAG